MRAALGIAVPRTPSLGKGPTLRPVPAHPAGSPPSARTHPRDRGLLSARTGPSCPGHRHQPDLHPRRPSGGRDGSGRTPALPTAAPAAARPPALTGTAWDRWET